MSIAKTLKSWLAAAQIERTLAALQYLSEHTNDEAFTNEVVLLAGRYNVLQIAFRQGEVTEANYRQQLNVLKRSFLYLIDELPPDAHLPEELLKPIVNTTTATPSLPSTSDDAAKVAINPNLPWILGLVFLLGSIALLVFLPCPGANLRVALRVMLALGAAGIATILPGFLQLDTQFVKAGSALAVFGLIFLFNPAQAVISEEPCRGVPENFEITVQLKPAQTVSSLYPALENGQLALWLDNKWERSDIDADGLADFKSLPGSLRGHSIPLKLEAQFWNAQQDSILLDGKSQQLLVEPDGSLGTITGSIYDLKNNMPLAGVALTVGVQRDTSRADGSFVVSIPARQQRQNIVITARKSGYRIASDRFMLDGSPISLRMEKLR